MFTFERSVDDGIELYKAYKTMGGDEFTAEDLEAIFENMQERLEDENNDVTLSVSYLDERFTSWSSLDELKNDETTVLGEYVLKDIERCVKENLMAGNGVIITKNKRIIVDWENVEFYS
jgi:hypothetical protein